MPPAPQKRHRMIGIVSTVAMLIALGFVAVRLARNVKDSERQSGEGLGSAREVKRSVSEIVELPAKTVEIMNLRTVPAVIPRYSRVLRLRGQVVIDPNRLVHVNSRFPGQVVELATTHGLRSQMSDLSLDARPLEPFDTVKSGAPMAMVWSRELGEKKSQLAEALAKLRLEKQTLANYEEVANRVVISDREVREQRAVVELARIAAFTAEQTLRTFQVSDAEIDAVRETAELIHIGKNADQQFAGDWARVAVTAPIAGVIVDKQTIVGEIVDANASLFKVADMTVMAIWLHSYEEDLHSINKLNFPLPVAIQVPANLEIGELHGQIDRIGPIIDPNEHMALVIGSLKNPGNQLRHGQFITGEIGIPPLPGVVEIPANALIDVGNDAVVFVQPDHSQPRFERRRVVVVQRHFDFVQIRSELTEAQTESGLRELHPDEPVVSGGALELEDFQSQQ